METLKEISGCQEWWEGGMNQQSTEDFQGTEAILYGTTVVDTWHCTFVTACTMYNTKSEPNVNYGTWVIMYHCRFTNFNMYQPVGEIGGSSGGQGGMWENSVLSTQFCSEPKAALKNKVY